MNNLQAEHTDMIKDFLNTALRDIMRILNAESGSFFLFDHQKKELILDAYFNSNEINIKEVKRRIGEGISGKVVEFKLPVLVQDIDIDARFQRNGFNHYHTKSFIAIPLLVAGELIGLINLADKSTGEPFSEKDLQFAVTLCKYACVIIEKKKLNAPNELLQKYASVGKLASGVVHQINNPLDGVARYTNILLHQAQEHSIVREYLLEIKKGLNRIGGITRSLLEFSHLVNSGQAKSKKYVDIYALIEEALDILKDKVNNNLRIIKNYDVKLTRILDIGIAHVLINIIKNAIDAMPCGGELEIFTVAKEGWVCISFRDTGIGMPCEIKERIFEPFFTTKSIDKGTGLGLAICKEIINEYEGRIEVQSYQGNGSIFTILIPEKYFENA